MTISPELFSGIAGDVAQAAILALGRTIVDSIELVQD
jgi:hypothetical protein